MNQIAPVSPASLLDGRLRSTAYPSYTARDFMTSVFYFRRALAAAFLIPVALAILAALFTHTMYSAQARLLVLYGSEYVYHPTVGQAGTGIALDRNQIMQGEIQILQSTTLALETLQQVGVERVYPGTRTDDPEAMALVAARFERDLTAYAVPQANVIELSFQNRDRDIAAVTLRALIDRYLARRAQVFQVASGDPTNQREKFAGKLRDAEDALTRFGAAHGITNFDTQMALLLNQKSAMLEQRNQTDQGIKETAARLDALTRQLSHVPESISLFSETQQSQQSAGLNDDLARLQVQRQALIAKYQPDFPLVQDVDRRIAALRGQMSGVPSRQAAGARSGVNPVFQDLDTQRIGLDQELRGLQARRAELATNEQSTQNRIDELNALGQPYRDLVRARDVLAETFRAYSLNSEESALGDALERAHAANIRVVQPPEPPPTGRSLRLLLLAGGVLLGMIAAGATLALLSAFRQVFVSVHDAERGLDLPVLLAVPHVNAALK